MTATEVRNRPADRGPELSGVVAQQVADILAQAQQREPAPPETRPAVAYRVPSPGVRYYF